MTEEQIAQWLDGIVTDVANIASMDDAWHLRQLLRRECYLVRGLPPQPWPQHPLQDLPPGLVSES